MKDLSMCDKMSLALMSVVIYLNFKLVFLKEQYFL